MKRWLASTAVVAVLAAVGSAGLAARPIGHTKASAWCSGAVSWQTARRSVKSVRVRATVIQAIYARSSSGRPTFLNLGRAYPSIGRLTVVIWGRDRVNFPRAPEQMFRSGTKICAQGMVTRYKGVPQIEVAIWDSQARVLSA